MKKIFIIKNLQGEGLGQVVFSGGKFEIKISSTEHGRRVEEIVKDSFENGISSLGMGEVILKNPCKFGDPLFFEMLEDLLARRGYIVTKKT